MNDLTQLDYQLHDYVATLTLNAPPINALTRVLNDELTLALDRISEMDEVRAGHPHRRRQGVLRRRRPQRAGFGHQGTRRFAGPLAAHTRMLPCHSRMRQAGDMRHQRPGAGIRRGDGRVMRHPDRV